MAYGYNNVNPNHLYSDTNDVRNILSSRNMYSEGKVYDLKKNVVSKTLDTLQNVGINSRGSFASNVLEAAVQRTPIVKIGTERLGIETGRRITSNLFNKYVSSAIDVGAIFSKNKDRKFYQVQEDYKITPKGGSTVSNVLKNALGVNDFEDIFKNNTNEQVKNNPKNTYSVDFYTSLGEGQRQQIDKQTNKNFYSYYNFNADFLKDPAKKTILNYVYGQKFIDDRLKIDENSLKKEYDKTTNKTFTYIDQNNVNKKIINNINDTAYTNKNIEKDILDKEGFGFTDKKTYNTNNKQNNYNKLYEDDTNNTYAYGTINYTDINDGDPSNVFLPENFKIKRGLLYYTNQLSQNKDEINQTKTLYGEDKFGNRLFKGASECRSFTIFNQYGDNSNDLIRFKGNGSEDSVLRDSVFAKIHPVKSDFENNIYKRNTHFMFSIENLAIDAQAEGLPYAQRGPKGGKIMWFPPYGLDISENVQISNESEKLLGRIEPIYIYNGVTRTAQITFILLIDYPPNVNEYEKWDLADYFAGCNPKTKKSQPLEEPKQPPLPPEPKPEIPANQSDKLDEVKYYFENDVDVYESDYEITSTTTNTRNLFGLNKEYIDKENYFKNFLSLKNITDIEIRVKGYASKLFTGDYNLKLSLRRAFSIAKRIIPNNLVFDKLPNSLEDFKKSDLYLNSSSKSKINGTITYKTNNNDNKAKLVLEGFGEYANPANESNNDDVLRPKVNGKIQKENRYVTINVSYRVNEPETISSTKNVTNNGQTIVTNNSNKEKVDPLTEGKNPFNKTMSSDYKNTKGFDGIDYYKPTFHSQTPFNFWERYTFLQQCSRPGRTIGDNTNMPVNSIFGKQPSFILRIGDFWHSRVVINSIQFKFGNDGTTWDLNPEGMGVQPNICTVTLDVALLGGMSMKHAIDRIQTAVDQNFAANSTYTSKIYEKFYNKEYLKSGQKNSPFDQEITQGEINEKIREEIIKKTKEELTKKGLKF